MPVGESGQRANALCPIGPVFAWHHVRLAIELRVRFLERQPRGSRKSRRPSGAIWCWPVGISGRTAFGEH